MIHSQRCTESESAASNAVTLKWSAHRSSDCITQNSCIHGDAVEKFDGRTNECDPRSWYCRFTSFNEFYAGAAHVELCSPTCRAFSRRTQTKAWWWWEFRWKRILHSWTPLWRARTWLTPLPSANSAILYIIHRSSIAGRCTGGHIISAFTRQGAEGKYGS